MNVVYKMTLLAVSAVSFLVAGCSIAPYAREVKKRPSEGGVIALKTMHSPEDRALAESLMRSNCGSNEAKVMEEGEVVTGTKTYSDATTSNESDSGFSIGGLSFGSGAGQRTAGSSETHQLKEWQISYQCIAREYRASPEAVSGIKKTSAKK